MKRALWFGLCFACACSSGSKFVPAAPGNKTMDSGVDDAAKGGSAAKGGNGGGGGGGSSSDAGVDAGGVLTDPLAPSISFTAPMVADSPESENVIVDSSLHVRCKATQSTMSGSSPVDKSSVKITLQDTNDTTKTVTSSVAAVDEDEFEAVFDMSSQKNGALKFTCTAKDQTTHTGSGSMNTLLDLGPTISLSDPKDKGIYALKSPFKIKFTVAAAPIGDPDDASKATSVKLTIGGVDTPISESNDTPGLYQTSIDFTDKTNYPVAPTSAQIQVFASDGRKPTAATRRVQADVTIDGDGPTITVMSPANFTIQHGSVPLVVQVTDPSGIMPNSLVASINNVLYMNWKENGDTYTQTFDTRDIDKTNVLTQLTINLTAVDNVGNTTDPPVSHTLRLDNLPPVISLDPPPLREMKKSGDADYCSQPFDPVGSWAASDLDHVLSSQYFRALVEDHTNHSPGAMFNYLSGTNPQLVDMYTQGLSEVPLLIDTNGDHLCDEIYNNENDTTHDKLPDNKLPVKIKLAAVNPGGNAWYAKKGLMNVVDEPSCPNEDGGDMHAPDSVCTVYSEMYRVVAADRIQGRPAGVYSFNPSNSGSSGECTGAAWEILGNTRGREGWICVAARAEDNIGNVGVSAPLRLCFDDSDASNGTPDCSGAPPTCTDGCMIADAQKFPAGMIWSIE